MLRLATHTAKLIIVVQAGGKVSTRPPLALTTSAGSQRTSPGPDASSRRRGSTPGGQVARVTADFLAPPPEDYTRMRQFAIDKKGHVINRGDSFRKRSEFYK
jgi:hypothetical protein